VQLPAQTIVLGLVASVMGCGEKKFCVEGLDIGTTYRVTVLEPADANSQYGVQTSHGPDFGVNLFGAQSCGDRFDFAAGSTFSIEPVSKQDLMGCYGRIAAPSGVDGVQLVRQISGPTQGGGELMQTPAFEADLADGCVGQWQLGFISPHHDSPLTIPVPGAYPPVLMLRTFMLSATTDLQSCLLPDSKLTASSSCEDYFVVKLEKT
jgi:hypothetical protein